MIRKAVHALEGTVMEQLTHDQEPRADRMTPQNRWESRFPRTNGRPGQPARLHYTPRCRAVAARARSERGRGPASEVRKRLGPQARAGGNRRAVAARARSEVGNLKGPHRAK